MSERLSRQARTNTRPERLLRSELHRRGRRFRVDAKVLPGSRRRHDLVFTRRRVVVEVYGCFWHACPTHGTLPKSNRDWWLDKLEANRRRDLDTARALADAGWTLVVVWEHEEVREAADRVEAALDPATASHISSRSRPDEDRRGPR